MNTWPWRLMIYGAGEAINGSNSLAPQIRQQLANLGRGCSNRYVAVTAQLDASNVPTVRGVLDPTGRIPVQTLSNVDVGDPAALLDYAQWAESLCPATRRVLVLSGHGAAWQDELLDTALGKDATRGIAPQDAIAGALHHAKGLFGASVQAKDAQTRAVLVDGHDRDYLSNAELGTVCQRMADALGGPVDVLVFDACLMSSWEVLCELEGSVHTVVGAVDELSAAGIDISNAAAQLSSIQGQADARAVARLIVSGFTPQAAFDSCVAVDLSSPSWAAARQAFVMFSTTVLNWLKGNAARGLALRAAFSDSTRSVVKFTGEGLSDVQALLLAMRRVTGMPDLALKSLQLAVDLLGQCIIGKRCGASYQAASGVSLFTPDSYAVYQANKDVYQQLKLARRTAWAQVLDAVWADAAQTRTTPQASMADVKPPAVDDVEFVVSLGAMVLSADVLQRIEQAIRKAVLTTLANLDLLGDVQTASPSTVTRGLAGSLNGIKLDSLGAPWTRGLWVAGNSASLATRGLVSNQTASGHTEGPIRVSAAGSGDTAFHVLLRGLGTDVGIRKVIESAVQLAVLSELSKLDLAGDSSLPGQTGQVATRALFRLPDSSTLGLILNKVLPGLASDVSA